MSLWTPERDAELRALFDEGLTCESIAAVMGLTKGAVIGRLNRIGLYRKRRYTIEPKPPTVTPAPWKPEPRRAPPCAPLGQPAELLKCDPDGCRWGMGEIVLHRHLLCNAPRFNGSSYCERHWRRSLSKGSLPLGRGSWPRHS